MYWLYIITSVWMLLIFQLRTVGIWYCDKMKEFWNIWMECVIWYCGVTVFPITSSFSQPAFYHHQCYCLWKLKCKRTSQLWTSHGANPSTRSLCCCLWWRWFDCVVLCPKTALGRFIVLWDVNVYYESLQAYVFEFCNISSPQMKLILGLNVNLVSLMDMHWSNITSCFLFSAFNHALVNRNYDMSKVLSKV